ncbi:MAG TPA: hypothetical protein DEA26_09085 [Oceanospirillales bacterium]|nr:hypothetical protein [Oceanospirillaceae bacterium]HBS42821.1 hypothetical protein [Oceanospirillales bacterium]|tara:strand:- start:1040 stop:2893 length:1854 start_codon:yes stop_codon:yes gene_type:complete
MTKWIRWSGLLGFVAVIALIAALILVALPWIIKFSIEFAGTKMAGAKVTLDDVDVTASPFGVKLVHLQVADARQPMQNLLEFDQAHADLELAPLLIGKAISNELSVSNLQFHTARSESGALPVEEKKAIAEKNAEPSATQKVMEELPSADEILARETLKTPQAAEQLQTTWKTSSQAVEKAVSSVPDEKALKNYEKEINAITSGRLESLEDFQQRKARLDDLKKQFKADKQALTDARDTVQSSRKDLSNAVAALKAAPGEDMAYLKDKYQLSGAGAANMTGLLFGDEAAGWAQEALYWYEKVKPYLDSGGADEEQVEEEKAPRMTGRFVNFPTSDPWPDFMIRKAYITGPLDGGKLKIEGRDITHQQAVTGRPTVFTATGVELQSIGDLNAQLVLNHTRVPGEDTLTLSISDWKMAPLSLGVAGAELASSRVRLNADAQVISGELVAGAKAQVSNARFSGDGKTLFAKELNQALAGITQFSVNASAQGPLLHPDIGLGSDLDRQLQAAFNKRIKAKQDELEARLKKKLNEQVDQYAGEYADELKQLAAMDGSLQDRLNSLQDLASAELESFKDQQEREAKAKLEAEKAEAKAKADAEAKKKEDELKNKAKDKLKNLF